MKMLSSEAQVTWIHFYLKTQRYCCGFTSCLHGKMKTQRFENAIQSGSI